ncbi:MAG TPA: bestrophin family ion channel [Rhizobiaceae bacterium]|nr:bestrophin family ion channel [Rhizobiaceae bacterium]
MIIRHRTNVLKLFFVMRGSVVPRILPHIFGFALYGAAVTFLIGRFLPAVGSMSVAPFALVTVTLSIYLGFRNSAAYDRWWEGRKLWGQLVYEIRNLARASMALLPESQLHRPLLMDSLAFCHLLRGALRRIDASAEARPFLSEADEGLAKAGPEAIVRQMGRRLAQARASGALDPIGFRILDERLAAIAAVEAGCERIAATPLPFAYTLLLQRTAYVVCLLLPFGLVSAIGWATPLFTAIIAYTFFGLDALSEELEDPFGSEANDLPLDALCRICEISVMEALGEPAPEPMRAKHYFLS